MAASWPIASASSEDAAAKLKSSPRWRHRLLGQTLGLQRLGLVEVIGADRGVGEHGDHARLHLEDAAGDEDELVLAPRRAP
jgi:hypothetical protein